MTLSDRILELRIWLARRRFIAAAGVHEIIRRHDEWMALRRLRRPEVVAELDRKFLERCRKA